MEKKINVFVVALPTMDCVVEKIKNAIEDVFEKPKVRKPCFCCDEKDDEDFTPRHLRINEPCGGVQPWGVKGTPADEKLRFGYQGPCIDEPRRSDYDDREDFEYDHQLFDEYVSAAEDCIAHGLEKKSDAPIHRCKAIRKRLNEVPPMNLDLIGETDWWNEDDWDF